MGEPPHNGFDGYFAAPIHHDLQGQPADQHTDPRFGQPDQQLGERFGPPADEQLYAWSGSPAADGFQAQVGPWLAQPEPVLAAPAWPQPATAPAAPGWWSQPGPQPGPQFAAPAWPQPVPGVPALGWHDASTQPGPQFAAPAWPQPGAQPAPPAWPQPGAQPAPPAWPQPGPQPGHHFGQPPWPQPGPQFGPPFPPNAFSPAYPAPARTPSRWRRLASAGVVLIIVATVGAQHIRPGQGAASSSADGGVRFANNTRPPVHDFPNPTRLLDAPPTPAGQGGYTTLLTNGATPVTWDPCQPIHFVVRPDGEIPGGRVMLDRVMNEISGATGLAFIDDGSTTEAPSDGHNPYQPDRYGKRWAPVLIAWSDQSEDPALAGDVVGSAGPEATTIAGEGERIVSGSVAFDAPDLMSELGRQDGGTLVEQVMRHELGHLIGLGHVNDPTQVMNPTEVRGLRDYGAGDLRGLAAMGSGPCFTKG